MREMTLGERLKRANWLLLGLALALAVLGVVCVRGRLVGQAGRLRLAAAALGRGRRRGVPAHAGRALHARRSGCATSSTRWACSLLVAVLFIGVGGTQLATCERWIRLGGFKVQPSEFMKVIMVITLAGYIRYEHELPALQGPRHSRSR